MVCGVQWFSAGSLPNSLQINQPLEVEAVIGALLAAGRQCFGGSPSRSSWCLLRGIRTSRKASPSNDRLVQEASEALGQVANRGVVQAALHRRGTANGATVVVNVGLSNGGRLHFFLGGRGRIGCRSAQPYSSGFASTNTVTLPPQVGPT